MLTRSARSQDLLEALTEANHSGHGIGPTLCLDYIQFSGLRTCLQLVFSGVCVQFVYPCAPYSYIVHADMSYRVAVQVAAYARL